MDLERERLLSLIEFCHQSARLRAKPAATIAAHKAFSLFEDEVRGLPGVRINVNGSESEDEVWLAVERLHETKPPEVTSAVLRPWLVMTQMPTEEPRICERVDGAALIAAGTHRSVEGPPDQKKPAIRPDAKITLAEYDRAPLVHEHLATYIYAKWQPWADEERPRRRAIRLYSQLFTVMQQLEGGIVEAQLELLWGVGLGVWHSNDTPVSYPLLGRLVELSLNPATAELEVRPRDVDACLEVDWYASVDNPGVGPLERAAKDFFGKAGTTFSPFDRATFDPLLRTAATHLDANGIYWPDTVPPEDRTLPKSDGKLKVTDTWVLFARPRTNNLFLQDLERLKEQIEAADEFPSAVTALATEPATLNPIVELPPYRGISATYHADATGSGQKARDIFFPKPFNDEQVRIVQLMEVSDGVVVQGPPGTGKTHTIANVICHYLADGKRVLVTSMKDPALAVLREHLPEAIRPLAISLLTSEQEGMKQFEHAITKIASEVQNLDRNSTAREIRHLEESIDALHGRLALIDRKTADWARQNLAKVVLEAEEIHPHDAAQQVVESLEHYEWFPDPLGLGPEHAPQFSDSDVIQLRDARRRLGPDIDYLEASLPQLVEFPDARELLIVHQDLSQFEKLRLDEEKGDVPRLAEVNEEVIALAQQTLANIENLKRLRDEIVKAHRSWTAGMRERLRGTSYDVVLPILEALGSELGEATRSRQAYLERPVKTAPGIECDSELTGAVRNLAEGKSPFGIKGLFGKQEQKRHLENIRIVGDRPTDADAWRHVGEHLALLRRWRELAVRWNALARELPLGSVRGDGPDGGVAAAKEYELYLKLKDVVKREDEISSVASHLFPTWLHVRDVADQDALLVELERALRHHLTKNRLVNVWVAKERFQKILDGRTGRVINEIRRFLSETLGNSSIDDACMQAQWSALMAELSRLLGLTAQLATVSEVCGKITASGAPRYAEALSQPSEGTVDRLLPDNWRMTWRLRRLATYLESIDGHDELKKLAHARREVEADLARACRDVVVKRTWLKLADNASPRIRAALAAYLNAIQRIGKGSKGAKRAVRYRQDARIAAAQANPAVPCWIMPHYRVSESLPAELGCFDLVIVDEASQSDLTALPSLLRAKKLLIVGDDKQVSPEGVGLEEDKIRSLMTRFLGNQVETYRAQMSPERSIYDLFKVVFAKSSVMLREHFRCVAPIIEFSKREFYNHELRPLRLPRASDRLDPPLIDVVVLDGYRNGDINLPEARFIVEEVKAIVADDKMAKRSIGVVSLLADKQALAIWERLTEEIGPELMQRHRIACGDARTFQGKERDVMFLSMVSARNNVGAPLSRDTFAQRFNVAASRARDRMYLVRSVDLEDLSEADRLRRSLIGHFASPFSQDEARVEDMRSVCESPFERELYDELTQRGYRVTPQVRVGQFRIDLVVEGANDLRLAIECDGDKYHGADRWADDMQRQRVLERAGWTFWRCFASRYIRRRKEAIADLLETLSLQGIEAIGGVDGPHSVHVESRTVTMGEKQPQDIDGKEQDPVDDEYNGGERLDEQPTVIARRESEPRAETVEPATHTDPPSSPNALSPSNGETIARHELHAPSGIPSADRETLPARAPAQTGGERILEMVRSLNQRYHNTDCPQCKGTSYLTITQSEGVVVICRKCGNLERVSVETLQEVATRLHIPCYACNSTMLVSRTGKFSNYLRCQKCGSGNSWQGISERI